MVQGGDGEDVEDSHRLTDLTGTTVGIRWMFPTAMTAMIAMIARVSWASESLEEEKSLRRTVVERAWHRKTNSLWILWEDSQTGHDQAYHITTMMQLQPRLVEWLETKQ